MLKFVHIYKNYLDGISLLYLKNYRVDLEFMDMLLHMYCQMDFRLIVQG